MAAAKVATDSPAAGNSAFAELAHIMVAVTTEMLPIEHATYRAAQAVMLNVHAVKS